MLPLSFRPFAQLHVISTTGIRHLDSMSGALRSAERRSHQRQAAARPLQDCLPRLRLRGVRELLHMRIQHSQHVLLHGRLTRLQFSMPAAKYRLSPNSAPMLSGLLAPQKEKAAVQRNREDPVACWPRLTWQYYTKLEGPYRVRTWAS